MLYIIVFFVALLLNLYVIIFGRKDLERLKHSISIGGYLKEVESSLVESVGDFYTTLIKLVLIALAVVVVLVNAYLFFWCLLAVALGTFAAKKSYQVPAISNLLNKVATYINRLRH